MVRSSSHSGLCDATPKPVNAVRSMEPVISMTMETVEKRVLATAMEA